MKLRLPAWTAALAMACALGCLGSVAAVAEETPQINLPTSQWKADGDHFVCQSAACGKGAIVFSDQRGAIPYFDQLAHAKNFSSTAMVNLIARWVERFRGYGPFNVTSGSRRYVKDCVEVVTAGTVGTKKIGFAIAFLFGPGDDLTVGSVAGNTATATHNLTAALRTAGY